MTLRTPGLPAPGFDPGGSQVEPIVDVTLRVVTPMIGGGVESGRIDTDFPVNGKSIRGHLRFWWRACHAHRFAMSGELFAAEAEIWGQSATGDDASNDASAILVDVEIHEEKEGSDAVLANFACFAGVGSRPAYGPGSVTREM